MRRLTRTGNLALWVVVLLIVLAPFPEGSAYPCALPVIEGLVFGLVAVWQLTIVLGSGLSGYCSRGRPFLVPVLLFGALVTVQLVPLPPGLLRVVSPATYRLYELCLPGWPREWPGQVLAVDARGNERPRWSVLPTVTEIAGGARVPFAPTKRTTEGHVTRHLGSIRSTSGQWRSLSVAPSLSAGALLELIAFASLFFLVLLYPFQSTGGEADRIVNRTIVIAVLSSGLLVAAVGIVEVFTWNGKVLWVFIPFDWGVPHPGTLARASGPFVSPDHFGDYLVLVLPLAAGGVLFRSDLFVMRRAFRVFCAVTAFLLVCALLLSLSRGAWIASVIGLAVLCALSARIPQAAPPRVLSLTHGTMLHGAIVLTLSSIALGLFFIGSTGRQQVDLRLQQTVYGDSGFGGRFELAEDTMAMVRDYPVWGIGLNCWPELFPHYRRAPWTATMYREAHNDYAQLLAETGILGFVLIVWFFVVVAQRLHGALTRCAAAVSPTLAAVCAALVAVAFHELFDFSLHTPANALLFVVLLALAVRMAEPSEDKPKEDDRRPPRASMRVRARVGCVAALLTGLIVCALDQETVPYPHNIKAPDSVPDAMALIHAHPAESAPHLDLVRLGGEGLAVEQRMAQLRAAVWLDPISPYARDLYLRALIQQGILASALNNITRSVAAAPVLSSHFYLSGPSIQWLSTAEKKAVEQGFQVAIEHRYDGAVQGLADFYVSFGRFAEAGDLYRRMAESERDPDRREQYLNGAGVSYAHSGDLENARKVLEEAMRNDPADIRPYQYLLKMVFGPRHELKDARNLVAQGVRVGANGAALYEALADAAQTDGDAETTESALRDAVDLQPSFAALFRLGMFYFGEHKYGHAALNLRRATEANPQAPDAYFYLGVAEEGDYLFSDADRDLSRAVRLAPANAAYRTHYIDFERKIAQSIKAPPSVNE